MALKKARRKTVTRKKKASDSVSSQVKQKILKIILSEQGFPIVLSLTIICVLLVLFRMKGVEQDYAFSELKESLKEEKLANKSLKAQKAKRLSVKSLRRISDKYNLQEPSQKQIIVIE